MPVLELPAAFRVHTRQARVRVAGATVGAALEALAARFPPVDALLFTEARALKRSVSVFAHQEDVRSLEGLATPLGADDELVLITAIAGG